MVHVLRTASRLCHGQQGCQWLSMTSVWYTDQVKIGGEEECIPALTQQMLSAEMQLKLAAALKALIGFNTGEQPLMALLDGVLGRQGVRSLAKLGTQVCLPLSATVQKCIFVDEARCIQVMQHMKGSDRDPLKHTAWTRLIA